MGVRRAVVTALVLDHVEVKYVLPVGSDHGHLHPVDPLQPLAVLAGETAPGLCPGMEVP